MQNKQLTQIAMFTMLITAGAFIKIPLPIVPFTLQFLFTMLAGIFLGGKNGAISVAVYLGLGLIGLPVFAEGGGLWYLLKPSFGYILGFCASSYVIGKLTERIDVFAVKKVLLANFIGLFIVYFMGMIYYYVICNFVLLTPIGLWPLFLYGFILAVPGDIVLCIVAAFLAKRVRPYINRLR